MNLAGQSATWGWQCTPDWDRGDLTHSLTHSLTTTTTTTTTTHHRRAGCPHTRGACAASK